MQLAELLLAQLNRETTSTRRVLERVPEGKADWKPHPRSMELGYLALLVGTMFGWIEKMVSTEYLDLAGGAPPSADSSPQLLAMFDQSVAAARNALENTTDEHLLQPWQLRVKGNVVDEKPRHVMIADTISHLAHHRGQLTVYLRLNEKPVPSIYGPTADEGWGA